ncbi:MULTISPECIES: hypothetical protein [Olivibacter]|uniref:Phage portal protein n=1 Tax=Olivibacter jilunii TaxID=985016 RepID=A0ABW6AWL7_9SPHI
MIASIPKNQVRKTYAKVKQYDIQAYDEDNLYPQRMDDILKASSTTFSCVRVYAKFIRGKGFKDTTFYKSVINDEGLTCDKLLRKLSEDFAEYQGFVILVNYNALYQISELYFGPFENYRLGLDETDHAGLIAEYFDWPRKIKNSIKKDDIKWYHPFNPDPVIIEKQVLAAGGWENYNGQIFYYSVDQNGYPLCSFDPVLESVLAEVDSDRTTRNNLKNNFSAKTVYIRKGKFEDEDERQEFLGNLKTFVGPDGSQIMMIETEGETGSGGEDIDAPEIKEIPSALNDKLFEYTDNKVMRKIMRNYLIPAILLSITDGGYFNQQQLQDATRYFNTITVDERILFEEVFRRLGQLFHTTINPSGDYSMMELDDFNLIEDGSANNA